MATTIFFDLFETLVTHHDPEWTPPAQTIEQRLGIDEQLFAELWRHSDAEWQVGQISAYAEALAQVCYAAGCEPDEEVLTRLSHEYRSMTARVFDTIEPAIIQMVAALKQSGLKLGIITNAGDLDTAFWSDCQLIPYFDDFVASHEVRMLKRNAGIFELACRRLEVLPGDAVFVGDGGGNELQGATEAGLRTIWATWFLDRWPNGVMPSDFPGGEWRHRSSEAIAPYERVSRPSQLLHALVG